MKLAKWMISGCLLAIVAFSACKQEQTLNATDVDFMIMAGYSNLAEIDAGTLASTKGQLDSVRMYGSMMVMDHSMAHKELDSLARQRNVFLPSAPDPAHQALKQTLMTLSGRAFDTTYMNSQITDHIKTIALFENEVAKGNDQALRNFATGKLPALRSHLIMAQSIRQKL